MDICRTLLLIGLALLLWNLPVRGVRPVRDFVLWGILYPFHFVLMGVIILVIWGLAGADFGLQGLFLNDDALTEMAVGATVMLLFAALILHYSVLDPTGRWWNNSLKTLIQVLRDLNEVLPAAYPVQRVLRNGFLERFEHADIEAVHWAIRHAERGLEEADPERSRLRGELEEMLRGEPFRLMVAPAILLIKGIMLVFLAGVVPAVVFPLFDRDLSTLVYRLPWLVGVVLGDVLGIVLACRTTSWAARAAGWEEFETGLLARIRFWAKTERPLAEAASPVGQVFEPGSPVPQGTERSEPRGGKADGGRPWVGFLLVFFTIHFVVNVIMPDSVTTRWIDWPERTYVAVPSSAGVPASAVDRWDSIPWVPMGILLAEATGAGLLIAVRHALPRGPLKRAVEPLAVGGRMLVGKTASLVFAAVAERRTRRVFVYGLTALAVVSFIALAAISPLWAGGLARGLWGYAALGAFLAFWLAGFWLSTRGTQVSDDPTGLVVRGAGLALFLVLYLIHPGDWTVAVAAIVGLTACLAGTLGPGARVGRTGVPAKRVVAGLLLLGAGASVVAGWRLGATALVAKVWLGLAILALGSSVLGSVGCRRPALLYPLTLLLGFLAFAVPYNALDERWQSVMPAAGSISCMVGVMAALYTIIVFLRPKSGLIASLAIVAAVLLWNGNAWFVDPNQFKATFPNMEAYYALPVYLDSRDYFRDTTPSTVRLRNRQVTGDFDRLEKQNESERLATAYFRLLGQRRRRDGGHAIVLSVEDARGRLRGLAGDAMRLVSEEWFTIRLDGDDCIALAEEPFYRKIYRWFRYTNLHMIRDGIIRGASYPLWPMGGETTAGRRTTRGMTLYEPIAGPGVFVGLRLHALAPAFRAANAQYVLISMDWSGRVAAIRHEPRCDTYEVEFAIPPGAEPLSDSQLKTMGEWLERCHLDIVRPERRLEADAPKQNAFPLPPGGEGGCLVLEDLRTEAPVPVGVYLGAVNTTPDRYPAFARFWPTAENLKRRIDQTPAPSVMPTQPGVPAQSARGTFQVRPAHDRGIFALPERAEAPSADRTREGEARPYLPVALYNAGRLRPGDRLILSWGDQASTPDGSIFEIERVGDAVSAAASAGGLPPGYRWTWLRPMGETPLADCSPGAVRAERPPAGIPLVGQWQLLDLLNNTEVLLAWKQLVGDLWTGKKPKLVLVTVSGGGIRASVWTAVVLRKLERTLGAEFPYHIRLITGASGGMVGGSYYATSLAPPTPAILRGENAGFSALHRVTTDQFVDQMATDQLDAVAGRMVFADIPSAFNPLPQRGDRGKTLEATWIRWTGGPGASPLARPLRSYAADERAGWRPSLVFTPMMVEDGRRLLVSNLDLAFATRNVGGLLIEPSSRKIERPAFQGEDLDRTIHDEDEVFSVSAIEFFRVFPHAHDFRVSTAVRMSASFPWVSPAISLPTLPPRRVVDAGYYDNYGVNLAALWLSKMRPWLEANTSGVVVIQIRDHVSQGARTEIDFDRMDGGSALSRLTWHADTELIRPGLQAISTPLKGISNAREWTMSFRNDEQVDLLDLLFDDERSRDFFRTVVFECPIDVSLNWQLSEYEKAILTRGFGRPEADPQSELARARDYLIGRDSYELHKWKIDHRGQPTYLRDLKRKYDDQLRALGFRDTERLTLRESLLLYENVVKNLKRLELLGDWWHEGQVDPRASREPREPVSPGQP